MKLRDRQPPIWQSGVRSFKVLLQKRSKLNLRQAEREHLKRLAPMSEMMLAETPVSSEIVAARSHWARVIKRGQRLRITDVEGRQGVDFLCYNADNPLERYHAPNTLKAAGTLRLTAGHSLLSDEARLLFTIVADTLNYHDTIGGCCSAHGNAAFYGVPDCPGCRENFLEALAPFGLGRRDIVPNVNFFCYVPVFADGRLAERTFEPVPGEVKSGHYVELRADMDALAVISNCPQVNNPCNDGKPKPIRVDIYA